MTWCRPPRRGAVISVEEVVRRYVDRDERADGVWMVDPRELVPYLEYRWSREHHRSGSVPLGRRRDKWRSFVYGTMTGTDRDPLSTEEVKDFLAGDPDFMYVPGSRWDYLVKWMKRHGWPNDSAHAAHLDVDREGVALLTEGNHRVAVALEVGLPVAFHFVDRVRTSRT